jgi:ornithine cyclodeaminase/alanine dehydrogenase-like protein (mu-crystallin family)
MSYDNPKTGKGWTDEEELAFTQIQNVSRLTRIDSIRLWKRFKKNTKHAIEVAKKNYPPITAEQHERLRQARQCKKAGQDAA